MTEIYLVRHTEAEGNLYKMMQGHWDGGVTAMGLQEIEALAQRMKGVHFDAVYSSDLYRARATAEALTRENGLEIRTDIRLREIDMGPWEGQFFGNIRRNYPEKLKDFLTDRRTWKVEGAETFPEVQRRMLDAVGEIAARHDGETIGITSHGVAICCFMTAVLDAPMEGEGVVPIYRNTSVTHLFYEDGKYRVDYLNDAHHIDGLKVSDWAGNDGLSDLPLDPEQESDFYAACYEDAWNFAHHGNMKGFDADACLSAAVEHSDAYPGAVLKIMNLEEPVGIVELDTERGAAEGYGWISLIYLKSEYRFKSYGPQLLARAYMAYEQLGRNSLRLMTAESNTAALNFYRKYGFKVITEETGCSGRLLIMERAIGRKRYV